MSDVTPAIAERMNRLFFGSDESHGYGVDTFPGRVTVAQWMKHLSGEETIGVNPRTEKGSCTWGVLKTSYTRANITKVCEKVPPSFIPVHGDKGVNIFLFLEVPCAATLVHKKLLLMAEFLGLEKGSYEVYPKPGGMDWMLMPYFDHEQTSMFAVVEKVPYSVHEFLKYATEYKMSLSDLTSLNEKTLGVRRDMAFADGPPCIERLIKEGFPEYGRYEALFTAAVYLRQRHPHGWHEKVLEFNSRYIGAAYTDAAKIIRSLRWKTRKFRYKCLELPMVDFCDKETCCQREYGIQPTREEETRMRHCVLDDVTASICYAPEAGSKDEPYWVFMFGEEAFEVTVDMARRQDIFAREFLRQFKRVLLPVSDKRWSQAINGLMDAAEVRDMAFDAGAEGQLILLVGEFCESRSVTEKEKVMDGGVWEHEGRCYFKGQDLIHYVIRVRKLRSFKEDEIWIRLVRRCDAQYHTLEIGERGVKCWSIMLTD